MGCRPREYRTRQVALLAEGVDRNQILSVCRFVLSVALLAEGVDRNVEPEVTKELVT